jgi:hypothetical protein
MEAITADETGTDFAQVDRLFREFIALNKRMNAARRAYISANHDYWRHKLGLEPQSRRMWQPSHPYGRYGSDAREVEIVDFYPDDGPPQTAPTVMVKEITATGRPSHIIAHALPSELTEVKP